MSTKVRPVEAMRGTIFGDEIAWFARHFYENSTPIGEGCESKKCKNAGCARTRTRERGAKDEDWEHQKCFSEVRIILLQASNKNIGLFPKNVGLFPKNVGDFSQNVGDFFEYLPRNLSVVQDSIENHARFPILTTNISPKELCPVRLSPSVQHKLKY